MKAQQPHPRPIIITEQKHGLPYSKGLMASSMMATGLAPSQSYNAATLVEDRLRDRRRFAVSLDELADLAAETLAQTYGEEYAGRYQMWRTTAKLDRPLIILVSGTTGVGKSTVSTGLANRLGITRIVSTDAIREVMRAMVSEELMPLLYESSFSAWQRLSVPLPKRADPVITGFREQTQQVMVGVNAIISRAMTEGTNMIIEGVHLVPGEVITRDEPKALIVPLVIHVEDEHLHRSHFFVRELETDGYRPFKRYRENFKAIRAIGEHLVEEAKEHQVKVIMSEQLDQTIRQMLEYVMQTVIEAESARSLARSDLGQAVEG